MFPTAWITVFQSELLCGARIGVFLSTPEPKRRTWPEASDDKFRRTLASAGRCCTFGLMKSYMYITAKNGCTGLAFSASRTLASAGTFVLPRLHLYVRHRRLSFWQYFGGSDVVV